LRSASARPRRSTISRTIISTSSSRAPEAHHAALELTRTLAVEVEYWPTIDPTATQGSREQKIAAYRDMRDRLKARIEERFGRELRENHAD
jgi:protein-tyrosine-phosphatase